MLLSSWWCVPNCGNMRRNMFFYAKNLLSNLYFHSNIRISGNGKRCVIKCKHHTNVCGRAYFVVLSPKWRVRYSVKTCGPHVLISTRVQTMFEWCTRTVKFCESSAAADRLVWCNERSFPANFILIVWMCEHRVPCNQRWSDWIARYEWICSTYCVIYFRDYPTLTFLHHTIVDYY